MKTKEKYDRGNETAVVLHQAHRDALWFLQAARFYHGGARKHVTRSNVLRMMIEEEYRRVFGHWPPKLVGDNGEA